MGEEIATSAHPQLRLRGRRARVASLAAIGVLASGFSACNSPERQDVDEPAGDFPVEVASAKFPTDQRLAQTSDLRLEVENAGSEEVPDLAVTIFTGNEPAGGAFSIRSEQTGLADPNRPVWILELGYPKAIEPGTDLQDLDDAPPGGTEAVQTNTFSFGPLPPGESRDIAWRVTPVQAGTYTVHYEIAAGLQGKANAVTEDGSPVEGEFLVTITDKPPRARVNDAGQVELSD